MNLLQLRRAVRSRLGVPTSDQMFPDDVLDDHINLAGATISSEHNWPWDAISEDVSIVNGKITMPADWRTTQSVFYAQGGTLTELANIADADLLRVTTTAQTGAVPAVWAESGDAIYVRPSAPGTLGGGLLCYYRDYQLLVEDTDEPRMPGQYAGAIIAKAAELLSLREDNRGAAEVHAAEYGQWLTRMRRALRRSTGPIVPRVRAGSWI